MDKTDEVAIESFLREITKELKEENVAIFAGAGLSVPAGYVNWKGLLRDIATDLRLDVDKEYDLVSLAQYHCNENASNRSGLNKALLENFSEIVDSTENHRILARLPIKSYWTTNYDKLIENSLFEIGRNPDIKFTKSHLATTKPRRDCIVYKMHGDIDHPNDAILTKDDYECYHKKMDQYISTLTGELVTKTFIFVGFSFTDPNLDYILSRVRIAYDNGARSHYCFLRKEKKDTNESMADFEYRKRKQELFCADLKRFSIKTILVDEFSDITEILSRVEKRFRRRSIFISGAAEEYGDMGNDVALKFMHELSAKIIENNFQIVSGFGLGIGSAVISGALEKIYSNTQKYTSDQLMLRPFPQSVHGQTDRSTLWRKYREDMESYAGIAIFVFGNKKDSSGSIIESNGMIEEFEIAKKLGLFIMPIAATGYASKTIWDIVNADLDSYMENDPIQRDLFESISKKESSAEELMKAIMKFLSIITNK